jgi:hypothetical protein
MVISHGHGLVNEFETRIQVLLSYFRRGYIRVIYTFSDSYGILLDVEIYVSHPPVVSC